MPYDDDDDLFGEEFDFVDDEEDGSDVESEPTGEEIAKAKPKRGASPGRGKPAARKGPAPKPPKRQPPRREPPPQEDEPPASDYADPIDADLPPEDDSQLEEPAAEPAGPPADHVVHIYEHGEFKRTIPRKFTDEEAVGFAEEYTRTGKAYGRYAVATPEDEVPSPTFQGASRD